MVGIPLFFPCFAMKNDPPKSFYFAFIEEGIERKVKVLINNLASFFLFPSNLITFLKRMQILK